MSHARRSPRPKPYTARSLRGAQTYVRMLVKSRAKILDTCEQLATQVALLKADRQKLAKLAAKGPCFFNPVDAMAAEALRDRILRDELQLNPQGEPIAPSEKGEGR